MKLAENRKKPLFNNVMMVLAAASMFAQIAFAQPTLLVDTGAGSTGGVALFGTGSPGCTPQPGCAAHFQYDAAQFTLPNGATLDSVQAYMFVGGPMSMVVKLYTDNKGLPGTSMYSKAYPVDYGPYRWVVFPGFNPVLGPGTYWLAFEPASGSSYEATLLGPAPNPLPNYAYYVDGNSGYLNFTVFGPSPADAGCPPLHPGRSFGSRITGLACTPRAKIYVLLCGLANKRMLRPERLPVNTVGAPNVPSRAAKACSNKGLSAMGSPGNAGCAHAQNGMSSAIEAFTIVAVAL